MFYSICFPTDHPALNHGYAEANGAGELAPDLCSSPRSWGGMLRAEHRCWRTCRPLGSWQELWKAGVQEGHWEWIQAYPQSRSLKGKKTASLELRAAVESAHHVQVIGLCFTRAWLWANFWGTDLIMQKGISAFSNRDAKGNPGWERTAESCTAPCNDPLTSFALSCKPH